MNIEIVKCIGAILILLVYGFIAFALCAGLGMLVAIVFVVFPLWGIILGTLFGSLGVLLYLLGGNKK